MTWSKRFTSELMTYRSMLPDVNRLGTIMQYKQCFKGPYKHLTIERMKFLIALKLAADKFRRLKRKDLPADALALLALHKERKNV